MYLFRLFDRFRKFFIVRRYTIPEIDDDVSEETELDTLVGTGAASSSRRSSNSGLSVAPSTSGSSTRANDELDAQWNCAVFFPDRKWTCPALVDGKQCTFGPNCTYTHDTALLKVMNALRLSRKTLDVCIYVLSYNDLANVLIDQQKRGVKVRVIVDGREIEVASSRVKKLRRQGIQVKLSPHAMSSLMHNKFGIIDGRLLMTGSFNWTKNAVLNNWDNVLFTTDPRHVAPYQAKFDEFWDTFTDRTTKPEDYEISNNIPRYRNIETTNRQVTSDLTERLAQPLVPVRYFGNEH